MIQEHPLEDILKLVHLAIEEEKVERLTPMYIAQSIIARLSGQPTMDFDTYLNELTKPKPVISTRSATEIENDFAAIIKREREKHGINI